MMVAQQLYEGIELPGEEAPIGLITYMRTDSVRVADQALDEVRAHIRDAVRRRVSCPSRPNRYKVKSTAQDAHEAIRPTSMAYHAGGGARAPDAGPVLPLPADLESLRRARR